MVNQYRSLAAGLRQPHRSYSGPAGRFLQGRGRGRKRRRERGVPCRWGPRRAAVLLDGQRPGPEPHREMIDSLRRRLLPRSRTYRYRLACDPAGPWGEASLEPGRGSSADRVGTGPVPRLSLSCVQRGYRQAAGGHRGHRGRVPRAGDLPPEEGAADTSSSGRRRSPRRLAGSRLVAGATRRFARGGPARCGSPGDLVVSYEGLFELAAYEPGQSGPFPR